MAEQEAQEQEWRKERYLTHNFVGDVTGEQWEILAGDGNDEVSVALVGTESDADRILADHKAQQEVRELREELARVNGLNEDGTKGMTILAKEIADLRAQLQAAEAKTELVFTDVIRERIGESVPCPKCSGLGVRAYGSTATWRGGIGGQAITSGICDKCWGSGDAARPWHSWRVIEHATTLLQQAREALKAHVELGHRFSGMVRGMKADVEAIDLIAAIDAHGEKAGRE